MEFSNPTELKKEVFEKLNNIISDRLSESTSPEKVTKLLIKWGNNEDDVKKMVDSEFSNASKLYSTNSKIAEYIRTVYSESVSEGLRGENYYYEGNLMNKSMDDALKALKGQGFEVYSGDTYRNKQTKEFADIKHVKDGYKIDISDSHGKRLA